MGSVLKANLMAKGKKFGIITSRFNEFLSSKLLDGALDALRQHGAQDNSINVAWVPGLFEIPFAAQKMARSKSVTSGASCNTVYTSSRLGSRLKAWVSSSS